MREKLIVALVVLALLPAAFAQPAGKVACDRACLEKFVDRYMDAMLAHDPSLKFFARDCIFTENGWQIAELFKIEKGNIRRIEAVFHRCPYGTNSVWSTYEQGISDQIQSIR
jgi:hypothetical protein